MGFWSKERLLRGVLTPPGAAGIALAVSALCASWYLLCESGLAAFPLPAGELGAPLGESFGQLGELGMASRIGAGEAKVAWLVCSCAVVGFLAIAAYIDQTLRILPDPLLALAGAPALLNAVISGNYFNLLAGAALAGLGYAFNRVTVFGRGDAKLMGVMGLWLGLGGGLVAFACGVAVAAGATTFQMIQYGSDPRRTIALGPWLVLGSCLTWMFLVWM